MRPASLLIFDIENLACAKPMASAEALVALILEKCKIKNPRPYINIYI